VLKIFISHSRDEEWLAEMIAAELRNLRVDPYNYERNETGTPITATVLAKLKDCDEFLILLTPTSIWSHWVLYELSVAHYLGKKIRPFFMYIREQEIPPAARDFSRRPMGEIQRYFDEIRLRVANEFANDSAQAFVPPMTPGGASSSATFGFDPHKITDRMGEMVRPVAAAVLPSPPLEPPPQESSPTDKPNSG
jgi:hypothetical protein